MSQGKTENVQSSVVAQERTLGVRFVPNVSTNEKAPKYRALIGLPGCLHGLVADYSIFRAKDGIGWDVIAPGGRFPAIRPANLLVKGQDGKVWESTSPDPIGDALAKALPALVKDAFGKYLTTSNAEQTITVNV